MWPLRKDKENEGHTIEMTKLPTRRSPRPYCLIGPTSRRGGVRLGPNEYFFLENRMSERRYRIVLYDDTTMTTRVRRKVWRWGPWLWPTDTTSYVRLTAARFDKPTEMYGASGTPKIGRLHEKYEFSLGSTKFVLFILAQGPTNCYLAERKSLRDI